MPSQPLLKPAPRARSPTLLGIMMNSRLRTRTYAKPESYFRPPRAHQALPEPAGLARSRDYDLQWKEIFCGVASFIGLSSLQSIVQRAESMPRPGDTS